LKQRLPIATAFWLPPLVVPLATCLIFANHLFDDGGAFVPAMVISSLGYAYVATALLGIPGFSYFRSKNNFSWSAAAIFGFGAGAAAIFPLLALAIAWTGWHNNDAQPLLKMFFTLASFLMILAGGVMGAAVSLLSWQMLKAYPPLQRFR
jgi:hypothetical protein